MREARCNLDPHAREPTERSTEASRPPTVHRWTSRTRPSLRMTSKRWQQWKEATAVGRFPVTSWLLAGSCLCLLAVSEVMFVRPERMRQERSEAEEFAVQQGTAPRELASGKLLMPDGRIVSK